MSNKIDSNSEGPIELICCSNCSMGSSSILELAGGDGEKKEGGGANDEEDPEVK
jgi:hypothetical protein